MKSISWKLIHTHCIACQTGTQSCLQLHEYPTSSFHLKDNTLNRSMCPYDCQSVLFTEITKTFSYGFSPLKIARRHLKITAPMLFNNKKYLLRGGNIKRMSFSVKCQITCLKMPPFNPL